MIVLDATTDNLEAVLGGTVTTNQPDYYVTYVDVTTTTYTPGESHGALNNTTDVIIAAAPAASTQRQVKFLSIFNRDTVSVTVTVKLDDGSNQRTLWRGVLAANEMAQYADGEGWFTLDSTGARKIARPRGIDAIVAGTNTITSGTVHFSGSGISVGITGNTLTVQDAAQPFYDKDHLASFNDAMTNSSTHNFSLQPFSLPYVVNASRLQFPAMITVNGSRAGTWVIRAGIYTVSGSTASLLQSYIYSRTWDSGTSTSAYSVNYGGISNTRLREATAASTALTPGMYYLGVLNLVTGVVGTTGSCSFAGRVTASIGGLDALHTSVTTANNWGYMGFYTAATTGVPTSFEMSQVAVVGSSVYRQPTFRILG